METIIGIGLALPLGVWLGYRWRDRISQQRRALYKAECFVRGQREALRQGAERRSRQEIPNVSEAIADLVEIKTPSSGDDKLE
jgi:hypothetical protein